ncbi:hypothetical protein VP01_113g2 [Puccinia sorghi]|uniref:Uncharacterized protein n=1 Tax=Puccinia sorghi TaxID=27349 RepID=A0A0L6VRY2_9BASI|nr:hypothetical protein VP01_113g2 [Puccinia sorghi]
MADNLYMPPPLENVDGNNNPAPTMKLSSGPTLSMFFTICKMSSSTYSWAISSSKPMPSVPDLSPALRRRELTAKQDLLLAGPTTPLKLSFSNPTQQLRFLKSGTSEPLTFFLIGGVCGLLVVSRDYCNASLSDCMYFTQAISIIKKFSHTPQIKEEPIWKNLSAYLVELFQPSFLSPEKIVPLKKPPTCHKRAEAITNDFLNHWRQLQPTSPFLIPHSTCCQITEN